MFSKILICSAAMGSMLYYICNEAYKMGMHETLKGVMKYFDEHPTETMGEFMNKVTKK